MATTLHCFVDPFLPNLPFYRQECLDSWQHYAATANLPWKVWTEEEVRPLLSFPELYDAVQDPQGKVNIAKWEILFHVGGIFVDPDMYFVYPFIPTMIASSDLPTTFSSYCGWKSEIHQPGLIDDGIVRFPPRHPILATIRTQFQAYDPSKIQEVETWKAFGSGLLTLAYNTTPALPTHPMLVFPSYYFNPYHATGKYIYNGHGRVFAVRIAESVVPTDSTVATSTNEEEDEDNEPLSIPEIVSQYVDVPMRIDMKAHPWCMIIVHGGIDPTNGVISHWLESITSQHGGLSFGIELIWVDHPQTRPEIQALLDKLFRTFVLYSRNTVARVFRSKTSKNAQDTLQRITERFPERDMVLQFDAENHIDVLEDNMFLANQMAVILAAVGEETEEEQKR
jgi:hypothetical protein